MKNVIITALSLLILSSVLDLQAQSSRDDILGVYKYQAETFEGMAIATPKHFIWVVNNKDRPAFSGDEPTVAEKARAFEALNIGAGTWEPTGERRNKVTYTQHVNPKRIGTSFEYEYEMEGNLLKYWIIQKNGERGDANYSRKIAPWNAPGSCSLYNGVWEYEDFGKNALCIQSGNYGAWIILNEIVQDVSTDEGKAKAFDALNAAFVIGDCQNGKKEFWNVIHDKSSKREKAVIGTKSNKIEADYYSWQILNAKGQPVGDGWKMRRIDK